MLPTARQKIPDPEEKMSKTPSNQLNRRDFLKILATLPPVLYLPPAVTNSRMLAEDDLPNIVILVFDSWSARHTSLYGYPRQTTPYLEQLAEKAVVFHDHYAGGHFTIPGSSSLLSGVLSWKHKVYHKRFEMDDFYRKNNLFSLMPEYNRFTYSHNLLAEIICNYMEEEIDRIKSWQDLFFYTNPVQRLFSEDSDVSSVSWIRSMDTSEAGFANSPFLSRVWTYFTEKTNQMLEDTFPLGMPNIGVSYPFMLEDATDWLAGHMASGPKPTLTYFHLYPPHTPYNTRADFYDRFKNDGFKPVNKPEHFLTDGITKEENFDLRKQYDEYILYVDAEIQRLFSMLEDNGSLENTWIILTSDHGEIFERGLVTHKKASLFEPLAHIPLLIFPPGQQARVNVHTPTSAIDLLPTLLAIAGKQAPDWADGEVLPPFNQNLPLDRPVYLADAKWTGLEGENPTASIMVRKGNHKLIVHVGDAEDYAVLKGKPAFELYDLENDPEELENLYLTEPGIAAELIDAINAQLAAAGADLQIKSSANS